MSTTMEGEEIRLGPQILCGKEVEQTDGLEEH